MPQSVLYVLVHVRAHVIISDVFFSVKCFASLTRRNRMMPSVVHNEALARCTKIDFI